MNLAELKEAYKARKLALDSAKKEEEKYKALLKDAMLEAGESDYTDEAGYRFERIVQERKSMDEEKLLAELHADMVIIAGHTRREASILAGLDRVPYIVRDDLTPEQVKAYRIADNKLAELSNWDDELLKKELFELQAVDYSLEVMGFTEIDLKEIFNSEVHILGTRYSIRIIDEDDYRYDREADGWCDPSVKEILIFNYKQSAESVKDLVAYQKKVLRHEIVHAFLYESGLWQNAYGSKCWAKNEEMIDWMAIQIPKIQRAYKEAYCDE